MRTSLRVLSLGFTAAVLLTSSACSSDDNSADADRTPLSEAPPGVYGAALDPSQPDPTEVATDAPVSIGPSDDAPVEVTYHGWNDLTRTVEVGGFVVSVVESGGRCTLTLTQGSVSVETTTEATPNVGTTSCGEQAVAGDRLSPGTWRAVLSYESDTSKGVSAAVEVQVP